MKSAAFTFLYILSLCLILLPRDSSGLAKEKKDSEMKPIGYYNYQLYKSFGRYGTSRGYFDNPIDIAIDTSENTIFIFDKGNKRIQQFDSEGDYIEHWDYDNLKSDSRKLEEFFQHFRPLIFKNNNEIEEIRGRLPNKIQIIREKRDRKLYEAIKLDNIQAIALANISLFGEPIIYFIQEDHKHIDFTIDSNGKLYIIDNKSSNILKFNVRNYEEDDTKYKEYYEHYEYLDSFGGFGSGEGYFYSPIKIAFDSSKFGSLWILDSKDGKLHNFDLNGDFLKAFVPKDSTNKKLEKPTDLCSDNHGFIFISDRETHTIYKYNNEGLYIQSIGKEGSSPGDFNNPTALTVDNEGRLFVVDTGNNRIQIFTP
ncbi:MAG: NHL repeat-containing protein [bacterium]